MHLCHANLCLTLITSTPPPAFDLKPTHSSRPSFTSRREAHGSEEVPRQHRVAAELDEGHGEDVGEEQQQDQREEPQAGRWWVVRAFCLGCFFLGGACFVKNLSSQLQLDMYLGPSNRLNFETGSQTPVSRASNGEVGSFIELEKNESPSLLG